MSNACSIGRRVLVLLGAPFIAPTLAEPLDAPSHNFQVLALCTVFGGPAFQFQFALAITTIAIRQGQRVRPVAEDGDLQPLLVVVLVADAGPKTRPWLTSVARPDLN